MSASPPWSRLVRIARLEGQWGFTPPRERLRLLTRYRDAREDWDTLRKLETVFRSVRKTIPEAALRHSLGAVQRFAPVPRREHLPWSIAIVAAIAVFTAVIACLSLPHPPAWLRVFPALVGGIALMKAYPRLIGRALSPV